ncbi:MAG TPA: DUF3088 family protein [Prolixibacteraceae bacterium]|jgi:glutaredoxin 2
MEKLFLLKPDFQDIKLGAEIKFFCPNCALLEGILSFYPRLRNELEVHYVDFPRPRPAIIELIGEANQSCPVLVLEDGRFINEPQDIVRYLTENYHIGQAH